MAEIEALDAEIRDLFADLPSSSRTIVTSHDAFQYFGRDYGLTFIAPQGLSTASEASAENVGGLIEIIRSLGIRAVFTENVADPRLLKRIADKRPTQRWAARSIPARSPLPKVRPPPIST